MQALVAIWRWALLKDKTQILEKPINISHVMVIAALAARRSSLAQMTAQALRNHAHITSDSQLSLERFIAGGAELLLADLEAPAPAAALIDFLANAPAGTGAITLIDNPNRGWVRAALSVPVHAILARDSGVDDLRLALHRQLRPAWCCFIQHRRAG